ncbi:MAG: hydroxymethylglutaryl-CoA reductase [Halobacteriota archaeon]
MYTYGSLENTEEGAAFEIKNRLRDADLTGVDRVEVDGRQIPLERVELHTRDGGVRAIDSVDKSDPIEFPVGRTVTVVLRDHELDEGEHEIELEFTTRPFGELDLVVNDRLTDEPEPITRLPREEGEDNYTEEVARERREWLEDYADVSLEHLGSYSIEPSDTEGNIENFTGVAQVPVGVAGPLEVHGEHAEGEYPIPLATTEGTLVASYNRGIKALNLSGGVTSTVVDDRMNRAPVFAFETARDAREFRDWVDDHYDEIKRESEETSSIAELVEIEDYLTNNLAYLRFDYTTGDAAGQNMVSKATFAACNWMLDEYPGYVENFYLEGNFATDKKHSHVNTMHTRGKRVTAEAVIPEDVVVHHLGAEPESLDRHARIGTMGSFFSGANNNGLHAANGLAALFVATGQDEANIAESSAALIHAERTPGDKFRVSVTIPSLIVATYGGGTNIGTQKECLELMGCHGAGKAREFAEVAAGVVLAGELSLASAISASDWVTSHEVYGRNR